MKKTSLLLAIPAFTWMAGCTEEHAHAPGKQQMLAEKKAREAVLLLDQSQDRILHMAVGESEQIAKIKAQYLNTELAQKMVQVEVTEKYGKSIDAYRQEKLQAAKPLLEELAKEADGRPRQRLAAHLALAEIYTTVARLEAREGGDKWTEMTSARTQLLDDASALRLALATAEANRKVDIAGQKQKVQSEQQALQNDRDQLATQVKQLTQGIDQKRSQIQSLSKERDGKFIEAQKASNEAFTKTGDERFEMAKKAIDLRDEANKAQVQINGVEAQMGIEQSQLKVDQAHLTQFEEELSQLAEALSVLDTRATGLNKAAGDAAGRGAELQKRLEDNYAQIKNSQEVDADSVIKQFEQAEKDLETAISHLEEAKKMGQQVDSKPKPQNYPDSARGTLFVNIARLQLAAARAELGHTQHGLASISATQADILRKASESLSKTPSGAALSQSLGADAKASEELAATAKEKALKNLRETVPELENLRTVANMNRPAVGMLVSVHSGLGSLGEDATASQKAEALRQELLSSKE